MWASAPLCGAGRAVARLDVVQRALSQILGSGRGAPIADKRAGVLGGFLVLVALNLVALNPTAAEDISVTPSPQTDQVRGCSLIKRTGPRRAVPRQ